MVESDPDNSLRQLLPEPPGLAEHPAEHRSAPNGQILVLALLVILATTLKLEALDAFVPSLAAALFVSNCVTAVSAVRSVHEFCVNGPCWSLRAAMPVLP